MRDAFNRWLSLQAARPSGVLAPLVGRWLEYENRAINDAAIRALGETNGKTVLEVGCGPGWALARIALSKPERLAAVDTSAEMVRRARRRTPDVRALDRAGRLDVQWARAEALPFPADSFDAAISVNVIYFWRPPLAGLKELHRVLRPGGRLVLAAEAPEELANVGATSDTGFIAMTPHELCALCDTVGFSEVTFEQLASHRRGGYCVSART